jgi:acyl-CoA synthetase (NDP forming)
MHEIIKTAIKTRRKTLTITESKTVFKSYGININKSFFVKNQNELESVIQKIKYPVVMKIVSPKITHKTDVGGVILNLQSKPQVMKEYVELIKRITKIRPEPDIDGVIIEEQIEEGLELIIGTLNDPVFGQTIMFGLGGVLVEVLKDVSFRLLPIKEEDAYKMIEDIKSNVLLNGYRGKKGINRTELVSIMMKLSTIVKENPIEEIDINPLIALNDELIAVDARIILKIDL